MLARRIKADQLRLVILGIGVALTAYYFYNAYGRHAIGTGKPERAGLAQFSTHEHERTNGLHVWLIPNESFSNAAVPAS